MANVSKKPTQKAAKPAQKKPVAKAAKPVKAAKAAKAAPSKAAAKKPKAAAAKSSVKVAKTAAKRPVSSDSQKEANRLRQQRFLEKHRDEINEKRRERYAERKTESKCPRCGKKLKSPKFILCTDCLDKARDYNAR